LAARKAIRGPKGQGNQQLISAAPAQTCPLTANSGLGAIGFDAVKHLVLCRIERRPPKLDLVAYPYLPRVTVATTQAKAYMALLGGPAA
jgi:hypothetical protein